MKHTQIVVDFNDLLDIQLLKYVLMGIIHQTCITDD